jgi:tetratricopeptide (TPR) repeat protein
MKKLQAPTSKLQRSSKISNRVEVWAFDLFRRLKRHEPRAPAWCFSGAWSLVIGAVLILIASTALASEAFTEGQRAYEAADFEKAAMAFRQAATLIPTSGTWQNLGNAEWKAGRPGSAILAWERAEWIDPFNTNARNNLRFARKTRLLDAPELQWYEICSSWLSNSAWAWLASFSFWLAAAMVMLPGIFRWRRMGWQQALAAAGFAVFLLTLPAMYGIQTRAKLAVVLSPGTILRLTPTANAQPVAKLAAGETIRLEHENGGYVYAHTANATGWVQRAEFGRLAGD